MNTGGQATCAISRKDNYIESEGISLRFHRALMVIIFTEGAFGSLLGFGLSSLMVWGPISVMLLHSLLAMLDPREVVTPAPELDPILIALYLLLLWRLIGYFWSPFAAVSFKENIKTLYLLIFVISLIYVTTRTSRKNLLRFVAFVVTFGLVVSLVSYLYDLIGSGGFINYGSKAFKVKLSLYYLGNTAGAVVLMLGLWNWSLVFSGGRYMKIGLINAVIAFFLLMGIASQAALGGYLASISVVMFYFFYTIRSRMFLFYVSSVASVSLAAFSVYYVVMSTTIEHISTLNGRIGIWIEALGVFREGRWLNGVGSGVSFWLTSGTNIGARNVHNLFIYSLASGGIIELAIVLFVFCWLAKVAFSKSRENGVVLLAFVIGALVRSQAESGGILFGYLNNSWTFLSWYVPISIVVLMNAGAFLRDSHHEESGNLQHDL